MKLLIIFIIVGLLIAYEMYRNFKNTVFQDDERLPMPENKNEYQE